MCVAPMPRFAKKVADQGMDFPVQPNSCEPGSTVADTPAGQPFNAPKQLNTHQHGLPTKAARQQQQQLLTTPLLQFVDSDVEHQFQQKFAASRRSWDAATATVILAFLIPLVNIAALEARLCAFPSSSSFRTSPPGSLSPAWQLHPVLRTFPCAAHGAAGFARKLPQVLWWSHNWLPASWALYRINGDLEGCVANLCCVVALLWVLCTGGGGAARAQQYSKQRTRLMTFWRIGKSMTGVLVLVIHKLQRLPGWPTHTVELYWGSSTVYGATRLLWHTHLMAVPFKQHVLLVPLESILAALCALLPHTPGLPLTFALQVLAKQLAIGVLLPTALLYCMEASARRAFRASSSLPPPSSHIQSSIKGVAPLPPIPTSHKSSDNPCTSPALTAKCPSNLSSNPPPTTGSAVSTLTGARKVPAKRSLYRSSSGRSHAVCIKIHNPPADLERDPTPLIAAVGKALQQASPGGRLQVLHHAVIKGCIQLVMWWQDEGVVEGGQGSELNMPGLCDDMVDASLAAANQVLCDVGGSDGGWDVKLGQVGLGAEGVWWIDGGRLVVVEGGEDLVVKVVEEGAAMESLRQGGGRVRVVLVEGPSGTVVVDEVVRAEVGGGEELPLSGGAVMSIRVPQPSALSPPQPNSAPSVVHLLVLPVGDQTGTVLWSTPLLAHMPPSVAAELCQLHTCMAADVLLDSKELALSSGGDGISSQECDAGTAAAASAAQLAAGQAYQQHLAPLIWDLVNCFPTAAPRQPGQQAEQLRQEVVANLVPFLQEQTSPPMHATLDWLLATLPPPAAALPLLPADAHATSSTTKWVPPHVLSSAACCQQASSAAPSKHATAHSTSSSISVSSAFVCCNDQGLPPSTSSCFALPPLLNPPVETPRAPATDFRRQALKAVLRGTFGSPSKEQRYQEHLKSITETVDCSIVVLEVLLLASTGFKMDAIEACLAVGHVLLHLWMQVHCRGPRRGVFNRAHMLGLMMALVCAHAGVFKAWLAPPFECAAAWRKSLWVPVTLMGLLHFTIYQLQAGFLLTALMSLLFTAQLAHILHPFLPPGPLCSRLLALAGVPFLVSFFLDAHHRTRFLRAAAAGAAASCQEKGVGDEEGVMDPPLKVAST